MGDDFPGIPPTLDDNSCNVVTGGQLGLPAVGPSAVIDGFSIVAAQGTGPCIDVGGGMSLLNSSPTIRNTRFERNTTEEMRERMGIRGG